MDSQMDELAFRTVGTGMPMVQPGRVGNADPAAGEMLMGWVMCGAWMAGRLPVYANTCARVAGRSQSTVGGVAGTAAGAEHRSHHLIHRFCLLLACGAGPQLVTAGGRVSQAGRCPMQVQNLAGTSRSPHCSITAPTRLGKSFRLDKRLTSWLPGTR